MSTVTTSFDWQVPTRVVFGAHRLDQLGEETAALGSRAAVVVDLTLSTLPVFGSILAILREHGVQVSVVLRVGGPPHLSDIREQVVQIGLASVDVVVALGGGSTMDCAKVAALAATNPGLLDEPALAGQRVVNLDDADRPRRRPGLPTLLAPSTAATGSELNTVAAIWHQDRKRLIVSGFLTASTALIDPTLSATLTARQLAEGGVETFARIVCPYLASEPVLPTTDLHAETLAAHCLTLTNDVYEHPENLAARADLTWLVAVSATQIAGLGRPPWAHVLWYLQDSVAHVSGTGKGPAMAALLPAYLNEVSEGGPLGRRLGSAGRLDILATRLTPAPEGTARDLIERVRGLLSRWGLPTTPAELNLGAADLARVVDITHREWGAIGQLDGVRHDDLAAFYSRAWDGPESHTKQPRPPGSEEPSNGLERR